MPYSQREENALIDRLLADLPPPPRDRRRTYVDPEGGVLRIVGPSFDKLRMRNRDTNALIKAMAGLMAHHVARDGACTEADLRCAGFSPAEIAAYRDRAAALARRTAHV